MRQWTREEKYRYLRDPQELSELFKKNSASVYRQTYHNQAVTGLINDPNGFVWQDGHWHLFYQWCPWGAVHGLKYWYHIISEDLVTWENLGVCLMPDAGDGYDNKGVYSGSSLPVGDKLYLYYTGNHRDADWKRWPYTCLACVDEEGWVEKLPLPLFGPNPDYTEHQRDPKIIAVPDQKQYYILLGAQSKDMRGCVLVYSSHHPAHGWTFAGELKIPGLEPLGNMWECPSLEHIGDKDVLIFCPQNLKLPGRGESPHHNGYLLGTMDWDTLTFHKERGACANNCPKKDRAVLIAWMGLPDAAYPTDEEEWSGCLTIPRELKVRDGYLIQSPAEELTLLREEEHILRENEKGCYSLPRTAELLLDEMEGDLQLHLFTREDGCGGFVIAYEKGSRRLSIDRSAMQRRFNEEQGEVREIVLREDLSQLRIFIDHSSIEGFLNDGEAVFSSRIFPTEQECWFTLEGKACVHMWGMKQTVTDEFVI